MKRVLFFKKGPNLFLEKEYELVTTSAAASVSSAIMVSMITPVVLSPELITTPAVVPAAKAFSSIVIASVIVSNYNSCWSAISITCSSILRTVIVMVQIRAW